jgi:hypothetical protein
MVMEQLPLAGIMAPAMVTVLAELVNVAVAPLQVVVGAGAVWRLRFAGTVRVMPDWVKSKPLALLNVMVSAETTFSPMLAGEKACASVGGTGVTVKAAGHAVAAVPGEDGAAVVAPLDVNVTVAVSVLCAESVTVSVRVPAAPVGTTVTWAALAAD